MKRVAAMALIGAALILGACGSDDEASTATVGSPHKTGAGPESTTTVTQTSPGTTTVTPTAPASAGDSSGGAPDSGITTRPGGPSGGGY